MCWAQVTSEIPSHLLGMKRVAHRTLGSGKRSGLEKMLWGSSGTGQLCVWNSGRCRVTVSVVMVTALLEKSRAHAAAGDGQVLRVHTLTYWPHSSTSES